MEWNVGTYKIIREGDGRYTVKSSVTGGNLRTFPQPGTAVNWALAQIKAREQAEG